MLKVDCKLFNKLELKKKNIQKMIDTMYTIEIQDDLDSAPHPLTPSTVRKSSAVELSTKHVSLIYELSYL